VPAVEDLLRELAPRVLGALVRRYGHFDACEDAVQEALLAAALQWREDGVPDEPRTWLIRVASRRLIDQLRSDQARRRREETAGRQEPLDHMLAAGADAGGDRDQDDTLVLLFLCCHPALTPASQVALTLRAVGGLTTLEIARAYLVSEATMAQRISRAKQQIRASRQPFRLPGTEERAERLGTVLQVLYLIFNEGYATTSGPVLRRGDLAAEAIRLTRTVHRLLPQDSEVAGLLALMLLVEARRDARTGPDGEVVPLAEQDRTRWDRSLIAEGVTLVSDALARGQPGPYQLQAAIAAVHDEAERAEDTDWPQVLALYTLLERMTGNPVVTLNRAVAVAMTDGPAAGLAALEPLDADERFAHTHRLDAVRAHLHEMAGEADEALRLFRSAAEKTGSVPERRYLLGRAERLAGGPAVRST
jgi:RNA polymerase sigma factor (sigma-70 family)